MHCAVGLTGNNVAERQVRAEIVLLYSNLIDAGDLPDKQPLCRCRSLQYASTLVAELLMYVLLSCLLFTYFSDIQRKILRPKLKTFKFNMADVRRIVRRRFCL